MLRGPCGCCNPPTPRNSANAVHLGGNTINFTLVAGPPNVHDMERGRRAGNLRDYADLTRLAQHFNCVHMLGNQVCAPVELTANSRHLDTYFANLTLTDKSFHVSAIGRGRAMSAFTSGERMSTKSRWPWPERHCA